MYKELKMKSFKKNLPVILLLAALGIFFMAIYFDGIRVLLGGKQDLDSMTADQIEDGMYVEGTVYGIYDSYAYTEQKKNGSPAKVTSMEYVIPIGEGEYMGLFAPEKYVDGCDELMQESWDYLDGVSEEITGQFRVKGTILEMESESLEYYMEYLKDYADYDNLTDAGKAAFLPYYLKIDHIGDSATGTFIAFMVISGILFLIVIWMIVKALTGGYQRKLLKYCRSNGIEEKVEQFYRNTAPVEKIRIGREFIMGMQGAATVLFRAQELIWAYMQVTTHRRNFITVGKSYNVVLRTKDGATYNFAVKNEEAAQKVISEIQKVLPGTILGYDKDIEKTYKKNREELVSQVEGRRAEAESNFAEGYAQDGTY